MARNGNILEIPLKGDYGFGYCKILDPMKIWCTNNIPVIFRIYNFRSKQKVSRAEEINRDLLIAPITVVGASAIRKFEWRVVSKEKVGENEKFLPDVKTPWPPFGPIEKWGYYEDLGDPTKMHFAKFEQVEHLDWPQSLNIENIPFRITMEFMKIENKDIKEEIGLENWLEENEYKLSYPLPIYSKLPETMKGKAII